MSKAKGTAWIGIAFAFALMVALGLPFFIRQIPWSFEAYLANKIDLLPKSSKTCSFHLHPDSKKAFDILLNRLFPLDTTDNKIPLQIDFVHGKTINAFASLNGHLYIYEGLLKEAQSPEELAAVLSHEISHLKRRHILEGSMTRLFALLFSGTSEELTGSLLSLKFGRNQESEADDYALQRLEKAKVSALGMKSFFERMERESSIPEILTDHPSSASRAEKVDQHLSYAHTPILNTDEWLRLKEICNP